MAQIPIPGTLFTRRQAIEGGITPRQLYRLKETGRIEPVLTGVFRDAGVPETHDLLLDALALVVPPAHVITDRTAALVHGVDAFAYGGADSVPDVELCALRGSPPTRRRRTFGGSRSLTAADVIEIGGLTVTTPLRTALDLGCRLYARDAMAAMNALARAHDLTAAELSGEVGRYKGRRGVIQLRELASLVDPVIESQRESWLWLELIRGGLPRPVPQYWIEIGGVPTYRLDFAYPHARVGVEYDGVAGHDSEAQRTHDSERRSVLAGLGWTVIVVRKGDFHGRRLDDWLRRVRTALDQGFDNRRW